jgi:SAM-dependent methyltransferase
MKNKNIPYIHKQDIHNLESPKEIVPIIMQILKPNSVIDFGCGLGTFLRCFKECGVKEVLGLDGDWVNKQLLFENIEENEFMAVNLEDKITLDRKFDLAISCEVAEHLSEKYADIFVKNLVNASDLIIFGASIPFQEGQNHLNEQWPTYWIEKFEKYGYKKYDILRPIFWNNSKIFWWYKQNMLLFSSKDIEIDQKYHQNYIDCIVHPELYLHKTDKLNQILNGKLPLKSYIKLLLKSIFK